MFVKFDTHSYGALYLNSANIVAFVGRGPYDPTATDICFRPSVDLSVTDPAPGQAEFITVGQRFEEVASQLLVPTIRQPILVLTQDSAPLIQPIGINFDHVTLIRPLSPNGKAMRWDVAFSVSAKSTVFEFVSIREPPEEINEMLAAPPGSSLRNKYAPTPR